MTGTSIIMPDAALAQASVIASQWSPEGVAALLDAEFVFDGGQTSSLVNRADPTFAATLVGAPTFNAHSMSLAGSGQGIDTNKTSTEADQTFVAVLKTPTVAGNVFASSPGGDWTGILFGIDGSTFAFYNSQSGVAPGVAEVAPVATSDFMFVCGWGSAGGVGHIRTAAAGALNAAVAGTANGTARTADHNKIGAGVEGNTYMEIAYAARLPAILTDAQQLAWYLAVKAALTTAGLTVA